MAVDVTSESGNPQDVSRGKGLNGGIITTPFLSGLEIDDDEELAASEEDELSSVPAKSKVAEGDFDADMLDETSGPPDLEYSCANGQDRYRPTEQLKSKYQKSQYASSTRSLYEADLDYRYENDRRYSSTYYMPNDDDEQLRMGLKHQLFCDLLNSRLTTVPLNSPQRILDVGTGTGEWAIDVAETLPQTEVTGIDIAAIQPTAVPSNVFFEVFDAEDDKGWAYADDHFDLVHYRLMAGSFLDWDAIYRRTLQHLRPGGYIEVVDVYNPPAFANFFAPDSIYHTWWAALMAAKANTDLGFNHHHLDIHTLTAAGFEAVRIEDHSSPLCVWNVDREARSKATLWLLVLASGLEPVSLRPLTQGMGWTVRRVQETCAAIAEEMRSIAMGERGEGFHVVIKVLTGRKPLGHESV